MKVRGQEFLNMVHQISFDTTRKGKRKAWTPKGFTHACKNRRGEDQDNCLPLITETGRSSPADAKCSRI